ncbi:hypothetical protein AX17_000485 [Amanita inopinata Kibby_2008]|nr:hypothetical protein AX17_000485 [Amanita inopinata Kibby_2008]
MEVISQADRIRLAIAVCALRFKPKTQSIASYVLDLQDKFPSSPFAVTGDNLWRCRALELERENLHLQAKLDAEKIKCLTLVANCDSLASGINVTTLNKSLDNPSSSSSASVTEKNKKTKRKPPLVLANNEQQPKKPTRLDLRTVVQECSNGASSDENFLAQTSLRTYLLPSMDAFLQLLSLDNLSNVPQDLIISTTVRSAEAIANSLCSLLEPDKARLPRDRKHLETLNIMMQHLIVHGLPLLVPLSRPNHKRKRGVDDLAPQRDPAGSFIALLRNRVFICVISAMVPLSNSYLTSVLLHKSDACKGKGEEGQARRTQSSAEYKQFQESLPIDLRIDVLAFFQANARLLFTNSSLDMGTTNQTWASKLSTLRDSLILATIREIDRVISFNYNSCFTLDDERANHGVPDVSHYGLSEARNTYPLPTALGDVGVGEGEADSNTLHQRVQRLAKKDGIWYLCAILHVLFGVRVPADDALKSLIHQSRLGEKSEGEEIRKDVQSINDQQAGGIIKEAIKDALLDLAIRCQQELTKLSRCECWQEFEGSMSARNIIPPQHTTGRTSVVDVRNENQQERRVAKLNDRNRSYPAGGRLAPARQG